MRGRDLFCTHSLLSLSMYMVFEVRRLDEITNEMFKYKRESWRTTVFRGCEQEKELAKDFKKDRSVSQEEN